jgi:hypothetical protein
MFLRLEVGFFCLSLVLGVDILLATNETLAKKVVGTLKQEATVSGVSFVIELQCSRQHKLFTTESLK